MIITSTEEHLNNQIPIAPEICKGGFDAISVIRGEVFIFKGAYVWRLEERLKLIEGYPMPWREVFNGFPESVKKIDAVYERDTDGGIVFFAGKHFFIFLRW